MQKGEHARRVMVLLPRATCKPYESNSTAYCHWCVETRAKKDLFKIRDGPVDWYFCNVLHAELWLEYRHKPETYKLCRMPADERRKYLSGSSMEAEISRLFPDICAHNQSSPH